MRPGAKVGQLVAAQTSLLQVHNVSRQIRSLGKSPWTAFTGVDFAIAPGEQVAIVGAPQVGKTLLLRVLALLDRPSQGTVSFAGVDYARASEAQIRPLRRQLQFVGGNPRYILSPHQSVATILVEPLQVHRLGDEVKQQAIILAALNAWDINPLLLRDKIRDLSLGLCARVALARALTLRPQLLVCDGLLDFLEPTATRPLLEQLLRQCQTANLALIWATRDLALAQALFSKVWLLTNGQLQPAA